MKTVFAAMAVLAVIVFASLAPVRAEITLEPYLRRGLGSTLYRLEVTAPAPEGSGEDAEQLVHSELEYPLDMNAAGFKCVLGPAADAAGSARLSLSAWTSFADPGGKMKDSDWIGARIGGSTSLYKFSYTESNAEARTYGGDISLDYGTWTLLGYPVRYGMGVRGEYFQYELFGADGWQRVPGQDKQEVHAPSDRKVLTYWLVRMVPRLYMDVLQVRNGKVAWNSVLSAGMAIAFDHDDHLIRKKELRTLAYGFEGGLLTQIALRISPNAELIAAGEFAYLRSKGEMDQRFYDDDPTAEGDETGKEIKNLTSRIISLHGSVRVGVRYSFGFSPDGRR